MSQWSPGNRCAFDVTIAATFLSTHFKIVVVDYNGKRERERSRHRWRDY